MFKEKVKEIATQLEDLTESLRKSTEEKISFTEQFRLTDAYNNYVDIALGYNTRGDKSMQQFNEIINKIIDLSEGIFDEPLASENTDSILDGIAEALNQQQAQLQQKHEMYGFVEASFDYRTECELILDRHLRLVRCNRAASIVLTGLKQGQFVWEFVEAETFKKVSSDASLGWRLNEITIDTSHWEAQKAVPVVIKTNHINQGEFWILRLRFPDIESNIFSELTTHFDSVSIEEKVRREIRSFGTNAYSIFTRNLDKIVAVNITKFDEMERTLIPEIKLLIQNLAESNAHGVVTEMMENSPLWYGALLGVWKKCADFGVELEYDVEPVQGALSMLEDHFLTYKFKQEF